MTLRSISGILLLAAVASAGDAAERRQAVAWADEWTVPVLIDMLQDDDAGVREAATERLVALGRQALPVCARFLTDETDPARKSFALLGRKIHALGAALTPTDLVEGIQTKLPPDVRRAGAVYTLLAGIDDFEEDSVLDVLATARRDKDDGARRMAGACLALLGWGAVSNEHPATAEEMKPVMAALAQEGENFRHPAYWLIGLLRPLGKTYKEALKKPPVEDDAYSPWLASARERLGEIVVHDENPPKVEELVKAAQTLAAKKKGEKFGNDLHAVFRGLRREGKAGAAAAPSLRKLMRVVEAQDRVHAARALLAVDPTAGDDVADALGPIVTGKLYPSDRFGALLLIASLDPASARSLPTYEAVLALPHPAYKGFAADRMVRQGASFLYAVRAKRVTALGLARLGPKAAPAKAALQALLKHPDERLRYRAALALRKIG